MTSRYVQCNICGKRFEADEKIGKLIDHHNEDAHWWEGDVFAFIPERVGE